MNNIRSWKDVFKEVSRELKKDDDLPNWSPEDVEFLHKHLWDTVGYYLRRPLECKKGILINELVSFRFRKEYLLNAIKSKKLSKTKRELYKKLIEQLNG